VEERVGGEEAPFRYEVHGEEPRPSSTPLPIPLPAQRGEGTFSDGPVAPSRTQSHSVALTWGQGNSPSLPS
jgi:hypothetical protein